MQSGPQTGIFEEACIDTISSIINALNLLVRTVSLFASALLKIYL